MAEFYKNLSPSQIPTDKEDPKYKEFWDTEWEKVKNGVTIDGFTFSGWLYWHLNHWKLTTDDTSDESNINSDVITITPELRDNELVINDALLRAEKERKGICIMGLRQMGKELANYEPLISDGKNILIGDAKIGDKIFDEYGNLCNITGVFPQGKKPIYRLHLLDGRFIDCGLEHLWEVHSSNGIKKIKTTKELLESKISYKHNRSGFTYRYFLPNIKPVNFKKKDLPIHPYILGALLGDGGTTQGTNTINSTDIEIINYFKEYLPEYDILPDKYQDENNPCKYTIVYRGLKKYLHNANPLNQELIKLNLKCKAPCKFIPEIYKYSSVEDRYELIRGLMDTDGSINTEGGIEIKLSSKKLIDDIEWVLRSLGIQCQQGVYDVRGKVQKMPDNKTFTANELYYRLYIKTDDLIFKLKRKVDRIKKRTRTKKTPITKIEYLYEAEATCISVDSPNSLFLTKDFIVTHNTSFESSYGGRSGVIFKNSQNLIMGTSDDDLNNITASIDFGLLNCTPYFRIPRITRDWGAERVQLGVKKKSGDNIIYSTYVIRNTGGGKKTEKGAGVSNLKSNLWDEIGKDDFLSALTATKPAMLGANGWRTIPICTGTGGNVIKAQDAKKLFFNPGTHTFLEFTQDDGSISGLFMAGWYRQDCKYKTTLAQHLLDTKRLDKIPKESELWKIEIQVSDKEKATQKILSELEAYQKANDTVEYNRWRAYYPLCVDDVFLTESNNKFPKEAIEQRIKWLENHYTPLTVDFFRNVRGFPEWKHSNLKPLIKFPITPLDFKEAPVCIYELPIKDAPAYTYTIGIDPINNNESNDKIVSLASIRVYKRMLSPMDKFKNQTVCSWAGRYSELKEFHELALLISEYYNAIGSVLPEASENTLIQYFKFKRKAHYFAPSSDLQSNVINKNTRSSAKIGLPPSAPNQRHYMNLLVEEANEEIVEVVDDGSEEFYYGVSKEHDVMLLTEMLNYKGKTVGQGVHDGNYDRIISAGTALTLAKYFDTIYPITNFTPQHIIEERNANYSPKVIHSILGKIELGERKSFTFQEPNKNNTPSLPRWMRS